MNMCVRNELHMRFSIGTQILHIFIHPSTFDQYMHLKTRSFAAIRPVIQPCSTNLMTWNENRGVIADAGIPDCSHVTHVGALIV